MIHLVFNATAIPRSTTREQWREIDRWRRVTERTLRANAQRSLENMMTYGTSHPELLRDFLDRAVNPPIMMYPLPPPMPTAAPSDYDEDDAP